MEEIRVWTVGVNGLNETFDDLDVALAFIKADIAENGIEGGATLESRLVDPEEFVRLTDGGEK